ncbi:MAG TPA: hypothetical protein DEV85_00720 [Vibrio sp.]|uniref:hypothetical protein n=1 Tax=Vibrio TaxID=662 RepID=UPI00042252D2|nr:MULTISPECIES: hypothetical protein [Vibrio]HCH00399.1 hypothetical protein [Vibrio sp.]
MQTSPSHQIEISQDSASDQLDKIIERIVDMNPKQLAKVQQFLDEMAAVHDFSSPVLTEQEKMTLAKIFQV